MIYPSQQTHVKDVEIQINILDQESKKVGLKIHIGNTKFMTNYQTIEKIETDNIDI